MPKFNRQSAALATCLAALAAGPLLASTADLIKSRVANYRELGAAFKNINDELRSSSPELMMIQFSTRQVIRSSQDQYELFPAGSGQGNGVKTRAKSEIWAQPEKFKAAQDNFAKEAQSFSQIVKGGDMDKIRVAVRELGGACKGCHTTFREPE